MTKRSSAEIVREIARTYCALSPENLWQDGEATAAHAKREGARLSKKLRELFAEFGRDVDECEAYELDRRLTRYLAKPGSALPQGEGCANCEGSGYVHDETQPNDRNGCEECQFVPGVSR